MQLTDEDYLAHYGILRKSGRYPWGSGGTQAKRNKMFLDIVAEHRRQGMSEAEIAKAYGLSRNQLQALKSIARNEQKQSQINMAQRLHDRGLSNVAIGERMGLNESSVRALLVPGAKDKADILQSTSDMLRRQVNEKGAIDVGTDVFRSISLNDNPSAQIGISSTKFDTAVARLREEGYKIHTVKVPQIGTGNMTTIKVLARPDVQWKDLVRNPALIKPITEHTSDGGRTFDGGFKTPISVSAKRVQIVYGDEGGAKLDGLIYVRPGAKDLSLGASRYAQVRIAIDGTHYLKGMAVYKEDLPDGADLVYHTNKSNTGHKHDAMKKMSDDPDIPFGAVVNQLKDEHGNVKSALNIVNEEGDWDTWSRSLPSQFLSKQNPKLAKSQLDLTYDRRRREFDEISALTNPVVRRKLLETFADQTDSAAVHLKAAAMPRQATKVIVPIKSIKEHEIYAPSLRDGTPVALVRFPHGGTFEIPRVMVNNKNPEARKILGTSAPDAIGIHHKVAERLSGADFDGDTVLAIPNVRGEIKSTPALEGLKGFDPKSSYKAYDGMKTVDGGTYSAKTGEVEYHGRRPNAARMQQLMGDVSNLITDMTIHGAQTDELARAVRHSMVVIDSEKHHLDFKSSAKDNAISALKIKYQPRVDKRGRSVPGGASTLISRAKSPVRVPARKPRPAAEGGPIDKATGKKVFVPTGETYVNKKGKTVTKTFEAKRLAVTEDAHRLVSTPTGTTIEYIYADHSNKLKSLANEARRDAVNTPSIRMSPSAKKVYAHEVSTLQSSLNVALKNAPRERQAQAVANSIVAQKKAANPHLEPSDLKKIRNQALAEARVRTGAKKDPVQLSPREWEAIQAGAISTNMLKRILDNANIDEIRRLATPRTHVLMTPSYTARARSMLANGYTQAEVAAQLGVSLSTLKVSLKGGE